MQSNALKGIRIYTILLLMTISYPYLAKGQLSNPVFVSKGTISNDPGVSLWVQNIKNPCGNQVGLGKKKTVFRLRLSGSKNKNFANNKYIVGLVLKVEDCKGKIIYRRYSINLAKYNKEGEIRNDGEWNFDGARLLSFDATLQEIKQATAVQEVKPTPSSCENKLPGTIVSSNDNEIQPGESIRLTVDSDGNICQNSVWEWTEGNCDARNQIQLDQNPTIIVSPLKTTTYYVRIREGNKVSSCISTTVYVSEQLKIEEEKPKPTRRPIIVTGAPNEEVCPNTSLRLSVSGGLDTDANNWVWKKNSCNGEVIGMGNSLDYKTEQPLLIFVQDVNDKESECKEINILVKKMNAPVDLIINKGEASLSICQGESTTLLLSNAADASGFRFNWMDDQNKKLAENTTSLKVSPAKSTRYYLRGEGECNTNTKPAAIEVIVINKSTAPASITETQQKGKTYKFSVTGGSLESGANWKWYKGDKCTTGESMGEGAEITAKLKKLNALSVRAEGGKCGASDCYTHTVVNKKKKSRFGFINVGIFDQELNNLSFTIGSKRLYLRYKTGIKNLNAPYEIVKDNFNGYAIPAFPIQTSNYYEFNGQKTILRNGYTGGFMIGGRNLRIYLGGGIGEATSLWGVDIVDYNNPSIKTQTWGSVQSEKYQGIEGEAGIFLRLGFLNVMGGINVINDNTKGPYIDGTVGIGLTF